MFPPLKIGMVLWCTTVFAQGVLFFGTGDPEHNTTAPEGVLADGGWQWEGTWGRFLGTPVAPRYFLTATHVGGAVSNVFVYQGRSYPARAFVRAPDCDLTLWRIGGVFPSFAPLYSTADETNRECLVIGRGTQRGAVITITNGAEVLPRGWYWGPSDTRQRWGLNIVSEVSDGGKGFGDLLAARFSADGLLDECHLSPGDSGGGVFVNDGAGWKLAGISYAVDGPFSLTGSPGDKGFDAALFDMGGMYTQDGTNWVLQPLQASPQPSALYATRVSAHTVWISSILNQPLPDDEKLVLQTSQAPQGPYADTLEAEVDEVTRAILVPVPQGPTFYRLKSCFAAHLTRVRLQAASLILEFE